MRELLGLFPLLMQVLFAFAIRLHLFRKEGAAGFRSSLLLATAFTAAWVVLGAEVLSMGRHLTFWPVLFWWLLPVLLALVAIVRQGLALRALSPALSARDKATWGLGLIIGLLVATSGLMALVAPPITYDSLTYHLPRQFYWIQQGHVGFFSTNNVRQLMMPPYAEYLGAQIMLLAGSDRFSNSVQWSAMMVTLAAVSLIARQLGAGRRGQLLAAFLVVASPTTFLQASSPKNDIVVAMFACMVLSWVLQIAAQSSVRWYLTGALGCGLGAMALTKGTGLLFALPLAAAAAAVIFKARRWHAVMPLGAIGIIAIGLNTPHFIRNYRQFGDIGGPTAAAQKGTELYTNAAIRPRLTASNLLRNLAVQLATPWDLINEFHYNLLVSAHKLLKLGLNDERITFRHTQFSPANLVPHYQEEDSVAAPAQTILILLAGAALLVVYRQVRYKPCLLVLAIVIVSAILFSAYLRWQPWHTRLEQAIFCLAAPLLGLLWTRRPLLKLASFVVFSVLLVLLPTLIFNPRTLFGAGSIFGQDRLTLEEHFSPQSIAPTRQVMAMVLQLQPGVIGLQTEGDHPDYIFLEFFARTIRNVRVYPFAPGIIVPAAEVPDPDVIVVQSANPAPEISDPTSHIAFVRLAVFPPYAVYGRTPAK